MALIATLVPSFPAAAGALGSIQGTILGEVLGDDAVPLENVSIQIVNADWSFSDWALTDDTGAFSFINLSPGDYQLEAFGPEPYIWSLWDGKVVNRGLDPDYITLSPGQDFSLPLPWTLLLGGSISGTVMGEVDGGAPVALGDVNVTAIEVSTDSYLRNSYTTETGAFQVSGLPPGDYILKFDTPSSPAHIGNFFDGALNQSAATVIELDPYEDLSGFSTTLPLGSSISGTVLGEVSGGDPEPLVNVFVTLQDLDENTVAYSYPSEVDGSYTFMGVPNGSYKIQFHVPWDGDHLGEWWNDKNTFANADTIVIAAPTDLSGYDATLTRIPKGTMSGVVTDEDFGPIAGATVTVYADQGDYLNYVDQTSTLANGSYAFTLPTGSYKVAFEVFGANFITEWYQGASVSSAATPVTVNEDQDTPNINAALRIGGTISGTIVDAVTEAGLNDVTVAAYDAATGESAGQIDLSPSGEYSVYGLETGDYRIHAYHSGDYLPRWYVDALDFDSAQDVPVVAGEGKLGIDIGLPVAGSFSGTITDALTDELLADVRVTAYSVATGFVVGGASTNLDGEFEIGGLEGGLYRAEIGDSAGSYITQWYSGASSYGGATDISVIASQNNPNIDAELVLGGSISGTITADPEAYYVVHLYDAGGEFVKSSWADSWSDHEYQFNGLAAGSYRVEVEGGVHFFNKWYAEGLDAGTDFDSATPVVVSAGAENAGIDVELDAAASISGTITDAITGSHLAGVFTTGLSLVVSIYDLSENLVAETDLLSNADPNTIYNHYAVSVGDIWIASYEFGGLPAGTYRVHFNGSDLGYSSEWYEDAAVFASATNVVATLGSASEDVDATLLPGADTTKPVIHVADRYVETTNAGGRTVSYTVSATDNVGVTVQPTCDPVSASLFVVGETPVTCSGAQDAAGNVADPVEFTVEVVLVGGASTVLTSVSSPVEGVVTVVTEAAGPDPVGYELLGTKVVITAPAAESVDAPLVLEFVIAAASIPDGVGVNDVVVFRDKVAVTACTGAPSAIPDPCVSSRVVVGGDFVITVLTTAASDWEFGIALDEEEPPPGPIDHPFTDIVGHEFEDAMAWMWDRKITVGCAPTRYCPERLLTREEMATFIRRIVGLTPTDDNGPFVDHLASEHRRNINSIRIAGITVGCSDTAYCPKRTLTRAEIATLVRRSSTPNMPGGGDPPFTDLATHWGRPAITATANAGVAWACDGGTLFCPDKHVDRAEMAQWIYRAWQEGYLPNVP